MKLEDKIGWGMTGIATFASVSLILRYFRVKRETEEKKRELELMQETERLAAQALLEENAKKLDEMMGLAHFNEVKRDLEAMKAADKMDPNSFENQVKRLTATANRLLEEG